MTKEQFNTAFQGLRSVPVDALQRASLRYAAKCLRSSGEANTESAALLLEQMADEHKLEAYESITVVPA